MCAEEQDFLRKRKKYVAAALKKTLQLQKELKDDEVGQAGIYPLCFIGPINFEPIANSIY